MFRKKSQFKTSRLIKKRRKKVIARVALYFLLVSAFVGGLSFLSSAEFLRIKEIKVTGEGAVNKEDIAKIAEDKINSTFLGLFSKSNVFLYPRYEIEKEILNQFKRILSAKVSIGKFSILNIKITERQSVGLSCGLYSKEETNITSNEECFYVDKTGFIFDKAPNFSGNSFVKYYSSTSTEFLNGYFLETEDFERLNGFLGGLSKAFSVKVLKVVDNGEDMEIYTSTDTKLILNMENDFKKTFENLVLFVDELKSQKEINSLGSFEQIDLQFGNKIFYKLK